eukprot:gene13277-19119_t
MFYNGDSKFEPGAVVCRIAPSFIRFGTFQLPSSRGPEQAPLVKKIMDYVIKHHYPQFVDDPNAYLKVLTEVSERTGKMIAMWQCVGFVHGVMNTDNMSILGLTIDYGPYDAGVMALALSNPALEVLRMDSCHGVSEKGMMALASGCKHLQCPLPVCPINSFGSLTMCTLAASCANSLESLDVSFCRLVTEAALGVVADACSKLECLKIFGCSQIGPKFLFGHSNKMLSRDGAIMGVGTHSA